MKAKEVAWERALLARIGRAEYESRLEHLRYVIRATDVPTHRQLRRLRRRIRVAEMVLEGEKLRGLTSA